jgi:sugar-specific transcriptional regulator TrmB
MKIKNVLKQLGLNDRHSSIYLACLELGSATIQQISLKSGFARSTCEAVLKHLQDKGFVTTFKRKNIKVFSPEDPKKLVLIAREKVQILEEAMPEFRARFAKGGLLPVVRLYQGESGVRNVLQEILTEAKSLKSFGAIEDVYEAFGVYFKKFTEERIEKQISLQVILRDTPLARERQRLGSQQLREVRLVPESFNYSSVTFLWNDKIAMFSLKEGFFALVIESDELANIQTGMFDLIWNNLSTKK